MVRMNLLPRFTLAVCFGTQLLAQQPPKTDMTNTVAWLQSVTAELRELRRELMADRIERQEERVRRLESAYHQTSSELQTNEEVQRAQAQEIAQLDRSLTDPNLPPEERSELEATRVAAAAEDSSQRVALTRRI